MAGVRTPKGLIAYPHIAKPKPRDSAGKSKPDYNLEMLFSPAAQRTKEWRDLETEVKRAYTGKWPEKAQEPRFVSKLQLPFRDADERDGYAKLKDFKFIKPWSTSQPGVLARVNSENVEVDDIEALIYPGCEGVLTVRAFAWENMGKLGVSFFLNNILVTRTDLPRLDNRKSARDDFSDYDDDDEDDGESNVQPIRSGRPRF